MHLPSCDSGLCCRRLNFFGAVSSLAAGTSKQKYVNESSLQTNTPEYVRVNWTC